MKGSALVFLACALAQPAAAQAEPETNPQSANAKQLEPLVLSVAEVTRGRGGIPPKSLTMILQALERAARERGVTPESGRLGQMVARILAVDNTSSRIAVVRLIGAWKLASESRRLQQIVGARGTSVELRVAAARALGEVGGRSNRRFIDDLVDPASPIERRYLGVVALAAANIETALSPAAEVLSADPGNADPTFVLMAFLSRKGGADLLAGAIGQTVPHPEVARILMRHLNRIGEQHERLVKLFAGDGASVSFEEQLLEKDAKELAAEARKNGDPIRGELIFRRQALTCTACHGFSGAGPTLGPDLAVIGSSTPPDYIVDALLRPSKVIKEFFDSTTAVTSDGSIITGRLAFKGEREVVIYDAQRQGDKVTIPAARIVQLLPSKTSLMPAGLVNKLNRQEFLDLVRFITELGRPGPYAASVAPVIRRWRVKHVKTDPASLDPARFTDDSLWLRAYSTAAGDLPAADFLDGDQTALVRGSVDVSAPGKVRLKINSCRGLSLWVDEEPVAIGDDTVVELSRGRHALTFVVEPAKRGDVALRVELVDVPGSSATYQIVAGP